ncbi:Uncharacterised protein [Moraxella caviae]|uniref:Uncharacterized protein n=1 Tax=Moraxella caviae TaxID=34060 RepID=A0A378R5Z3_9GAMM|nr:hypothetical protein [Moraxella caviae]STZ10634.1 Uncharacterised protein [Moraxella caviae]
MKFLLIFQEFIPLMMDIYQDIKRHAKRPKVAMVLAMGALLGILAADFWVG